MQNPESLQGVDGRGVWGRKDTYICMAESLCCPPETITTLLFSYTPIQNKKLKKKKQSMQKSPVWFLPLRSPLPSWLHKINTRDSAANNTRKHIIPYSGEVQIVGGKGVRATLEKRELEEDKGTKKRHADELRLSTWSSNMTHVMFEELRKQFRWN